MRTTPHSLHPSVVGLIAQRRFCEHSFASGDVAALRWHGLAAEAAAQMDVGAVNSNEASSLFQAARSDRIRSMAAVSTATRVTTVLRAAGLRALSYKGPALAVQTAGVWSRRGSADADILIAQDDVPDAHKALKGEGLYRRSGHSGPPGKFLKYRDSECAYLGLPCSVDLHWRLEDSPAYCRLPFAELWARREEVTLVGHPIDTLGQIDALLVTAVHGSREHWWKWRWALDANRQLEAVSLAQWHAAVERARRAGAMRALATALAVATICGLTRSDLPEPNARIMRLATASLMAPVMPGEKSPSAAMSRRLDRWRLADTALASIDGAARAAARQLFTESRTFALSAKHGCAR